MSYFSEQFHFKSRQLLKFYAILARIVAKRNSEIRKRIIII